MAAIAAMPWWFDRSSASKTGPGFADLSQTAVWPVSNMSESWPASHWLTATPVTKHDDIVDPTYPFQSHHNVLGKALVSVPVE